jgi:hypothetical protein
MANETETIPSPPALPGYGMQDGDQIMDSNGNIFEYNAETNGWIYRGQIEVPDVVTRDSDGLVYPSVYRKLELIQELMDRGIDFGIFKLNTPGETPYYYFFYSSDDLIRFYPESGSRLRMELDRGRLYQKLLRTCCPGPKGAQGTKGSTGRAGIPAEDEEFQNPISVTGGVFEFETTVATPIDTEISLRLFRGDQILVEYLVAIETGSEIVSVGGATRNLSEDEKAAAELEFEARGDAAEGHIDEAIEKLQQILDLGIETVDSENIQLMIDSLQADNVLPESTNPLTIIIYDDNIDVSITGTEIHFDNSNNRLWGTLAFTSGDSDIASWKYKARQRGPKGKTGTDGSPFIEVLSQTVGDPSVRSGSAVITVRKSDLTNNIIFLNGTLPDDVCVSTLALSASTLPLDEILDIKYVAAKVTTKRCKDIGSYQYQPPDYNPPDLELPAWEPTPDCVSAARYSSYKFEWWDSTDPKYPYRIVTPPRPEETCCQEPFFWCPNVGDNPCGVNHWRCGGIEKLPSGIADAQGLSCDGEAREPILKAPMPHPPDCNCECDSPIAFELQDGGYLLGTVILGPNGEDTNSIAEYSVIDGRTDTYKANFRSDGPIEIVISLDWKPEVCGGEAVEEENCQYRENCEVHTTVVFEDKNQNAEIDGGGVSELSTIPGTLTFNVRPLSGDEVDININIMINDTRSQCCRGYQMMMISQYKGTGVNPAAQPDVQVVDVDWNG